MKKMHTNKYSNCFWSAFFHGFQIYKYGKKAAIKCEFRDTCEYNRSELKWEKDVEHKENFEEQKQGIYGEGGELWEWSVDKTEYVFWNQKGCWDSEQFF